MVGFVLAALIALQGTPVPTSADATAAEYIGTAEVYPGQVGIAVKQYRIAGTPFGGLVGFDLTVRAFRTPEEARAGVAIRRDYLLTLEYESATVGREASFPGYGDASVAIARRVEVEGRTFDYGYLIVATGPYLYTWTGIARPGTPLDGLADLAAAFFPAPISGANPDNPASLLSILPPLEQVPLGLVLRDEAALATDGVARPATPTP